MGYFRRSGPAVALALALAACQSGGDGGPVPAGAGGAAGAGPGGAAGSERPGGAAGAPSARDRDGDGVADGDDCAPDDPARAHRAAGLYVDRDGDGFTAGGPVEACLGPEGARGAGYATGRGAGDCDDGDAGVGAAVEVYADDDGDGFGAGAPEARCLPSGLPAGYALAGGDCAPGDAERWQVLAYHYVDLDFDGATIASEGAACAGLVPPPGYETAAGPADCDDGDPTASAPGLFFADPDGDGKVPAGRAVLYECPGGGRGRSRFGDEGAAFVEGGDMRYERAPNGPWVGRQAVRPSGAASRGRTAAEWPRRARSRRLAPLALLAAVLQAGACAGPASREPSAAPAAATAPAVTASPEPGAPPIAGRLPPDVRPLRYRLDLSLDPAQNVYEGDVEIDLALERPRGVLWLHGRGLELQPPAVRGADGTPIAGEARPGDNGLVAIALPTSVGPGQVTLRVHFRAKTERGCGGIYRHEPANDAYVYSQFEPTYARDAFPGFDEPGFKAPFDVSITAPPQHVAVSNAREVSAEMRAGRKKTVFATTPPLPTYALAFAVGPFDVVEAPPVPPNALRPRPLRLRGVAPRGEGVRLRWALGQVPALLDDLERYLDAPYPFDKLDFLAVPCPYPTAAENAGAVAVSRQVLLREPGRSTEAERRATTAVIAHELAHMWFGNSVTPGWWSDLWLKEAFASWFEATAVGRVRGDDRAGVALLNDALDAMAFDYAATAPALRRPARSEADVLGRYDGLTYNKGPAVLGMVERFAGADAFRGVLRAHVARHRGATATADDLFGELEAGAGRDAAEALRSFVTQPGVPRVEARLDCGGAAPALRLRQSRYVPFGRKGDAARTWHLPVCVRYADVGGVRERCAVLREAEGVLELPTSRCPAWVMPNADGAGYYRWQMPAADLRRLGAALPSLSARERISFVDAVHAGSAHGALEPAEAFGLLAPLARGPEPAVALALARRLTWARHLLSAEPARVRDLERFAQQIYAAPLAAVGIEPTSGDSPERAALRSELLPFLALTARDPGVRARLAATGRAHLEAGGSAPPPDTLALRLAVADGGAPMFDAALARLASAHPDNRWPYLYALASTEQPELAARARALALDPRVRHGEVFSLLSALVEGPSTRDAAWDWVAANLSALRARALDEHFARFPRLAAGLCEPRRADELVARFASPAPDDALAAELEANVENIRSCAAQREAQNGPLRAYFARVRGDVVARPKPGRK